MFVNCHHILVRNQEMLMVSIALTRLSSIMISVKLADHRKITNFALDIFTHI